MPFPSEEKYLQRAEGLIGFTLPQSLRRRLLLENGGEWADTNEVWRLYPVRDDSSKKRLKRTAYDLLKETESARKWTGFPELAVAIGSNDMGDLLIVFPDDQKIYTWRHETGQVEPSGF